MFYKTNITLNLTGLVLFDPIVLNEFLTENSIHEKNLLNYFNDNPEIGNKAINEGILLPIYTITAWDYVVILNTDSESAVNSEWKLFVTDINFPLKVKGDRVIVSDIYAILEWNSDYYLNFPPQRRTGRS